MTDHVPLVPLNQVIVPRITGVNERAGLLACDFAL